MIRATTTKFVMSLNCCYFDLLYRTSDIEINLIIVHVKCSIRSRNKPNNFQHLIYKLIIKKIINKFFCDCHDVVYTLMRKYNIKYGT